MRVKRSMKAVRLSPSSLRSSSPASSNLAQASARDTPDLPGSPLATPPRMMVPTPALRGLRDPALMLAVERRVWDLEDVEHAHVDVIGEVRHDRRGSQQPDLARRLQVQQGLDGVFLLDQGLRRERSGTAPRRGTRFSSASRLWSTPAVMLSRVKT